MPSDGNYLIPQETLPIRAFTVERRIGNIVSRVRDEVNIPLGHVATIARSRYPGWTVVNVEIVLKTP